MRYRNPLQPALLVEHVHCAPVGKMGHGQGRDAPQGLLVVGGTSEFRAGLCQESQVRLLALAASMSEQTPLMARAGLRRRGSSGPRLPASGRTRRASSPDTAPCATRRERLLECSLHQSLVLGMHESQVVGRHGRVGNDTVNREHFRGPPPLAGEQVGMECRGRPAAMRLAGACGRARRPRMQMWKRRLRARRSGLLLAGLVASWAATQHCDGHRDIGA